MCGPEGQKMTKEKSRRWTGKTALLEIFMLRFQPPEISGEQTDNDAQENKREQHRFVDLFDEDKLDFSSVALHRLFFDDQAHLFHHVEQHTPHGTLRSIENAMSVVGALQANDKVVPMSALVYISAMTSIRTHPEDQRTWRVSLWIGGSGSRSEELILGTPQALVTGEALCAFDQ